MKWIRGLLGGRTKEGERPSPSTAVMTEAAARALAESEAAKRGLAWRPAVEAEFLYHRERPCWFVKSNAWGRGFSVEVIIDDEAQTVLETRVLPR